MKSIFEKYVTLNTWANNLLREEWTINEDELETSTPYGSIKELTVHLINTMNHWFDFFDEQFKIDRSEDDVNYSDWLDIIELWIDTDTRFENIIESFEEDDFEAYFTYTHDNVETYKMKFSDLFLHLICHSYYHRGQLAMISRLRGFNPIPPTDADDFFKILVS